jgi:hypothetical protein
MCNVPKLMKPEMMIAATFISGREGKETRLSDQFHSLKLLKGERGSERRSINVLTTITNTSRVLCPGVKHGSDDQKARHEGTFTYSEKESNNKETGKVLASRMAT